MGMLSRYIDIGSQYATHIRVIRHASPGWGLVAAACTTTQATAIVLSMVASGQMVGALLQASGAGSNATSRLWTWFVVFVALNVGAQLVGGLGEIANAKVAARYLERVLDLVAEAGVGTAGLEKLDSPGYSGRLDTLLQQTRGWWFRTGVEQGWSVLRIRMVGLGSVLVLIGWRWWVPIVVVASFLVLSRAFGRHIDSLWSRQLNEEAMEIRWARYVRAILTKPAYAKEVRLFGLVGWLVTRYRTAWTAATEATWARRMDTVPPLVWASLFVMITVAGSLTLLAHDAFNGIVSVAVLVTLIQATLALESFGIAGEAQIGLSIATSVLRELCSVRRSAGLQALQPGSIFRPALKRDVGAAAVRIENLEFTYPTRKSATLRGASLVIPAGQSIAIVGINGAGKSTLIKLIAGLYSPDKGTVQVDGENPFERPETRSRVAVIFQDFIRYPLTLRENIEFGAIELREDDRLLQDAFTSAGGDAILRRGINWDTVLSPEYEGGTDLSGGQWQRVALARALAAVAGGAGVLVLDEPAASLDVRAEAALFDRFLEMTRGVTTILVSHRLSSVRHADRIVVLDGSIGAFTEDGSHEELMASGGTYARMFTLQASRFVSGR